MYGITACPHFLLTVILCNDADIWVYGMAFIGCGWLGNNSIRRKGRWFRICKLERHI